MYSQLSPFFVVSQGQGCPVSPFLFDFSVDDLLRRTFDVVENGDVELLPDPIVAGSNYADDVTLLGDNFQVVQAALYHLSAEVSMYGIQLAPSKCKVLFRDCQGGPTALTPRGERFEIFNSFLCSGIRNSAVGSVGDEISLRISKFRLAFVNFRHLWLHRDIRLSLKGRV